MSFDFKGAIIARDLLLGLGCPDDQADGVCEAILRHQSISENGGNITMIGQMLQLAAGIDNVGRRASLLHPLLIEDSCKVYPRKSWSEHFTAILEKEMVLKPWCHTTAFERPNWREGEPSNCAMMLRGNKVMRMFE